MTSESTPYSSNHSHSNLRLRFEQILRSTSMHSFSLLISWFEIDNTSQSGDPRLHKNRCLTRPPRSDSPEFPADVNCKIITFAGRQIGQRELLYAIICVTDLTVSRIWWKHRCIEPFIKQVFWSHLHCHGDSLNSEQFTDDRINQEPWRDFLSKDVPMYLSHPNRDFIFTE